MHYAFIDESGTVGVPGGTNFFVVALINADHPREIEMPVRRAYKKENSLKRKELQAADAVAWAFFQKYEHNNTDFYNRITSKIKSEEVLIIKDWTKLNK